MPIVSRSQVDRVIYLDFDGVLHPAGIRRHYQTGELSCDDKGPLFRWLPVLESLLEGHDVRIILSTSWVSAFGFQETLTYLPESLKARIIGSTWEPGRTLVQKSFFVRQFRDEQIVADAKLRGIPIENWLAIDDDIEAVSPHLRGNFAPCDPYKGLSDPVAQAYVTCWIEKNPVKK